MAIFEQLGEAIGNGSGYAATVLVLSPPEGLMMAVATISGSPVLVLKSKGSAVSLSALISTPVLYVKQAGVSIGRATSSSTGIRKQSLQTGASIASAAASVYVAERDIPNNLRSYLPDVIRNSKLIQSLQKAHGIEAVRFSALAQKLAQNYFVDTADEESLDLREASLGIKVRPGQTLQARRNRIKKRLQGLGLVTWESYALLLKDRFYVCSPQELPSQYRVITTILSKRGIPNDINDMVIFADETLPAHLIHEFAYTYLPWEEAEQVELTWDEAEQYTCKELEEAFLIPFEGGGEEDEY